jgi:hypothetical protein
MRDIIARQHAFSAKFATPRHNLFILKVPAAEVPTERRFLGKWTADVKHVGTITAKKKVR